MIMAHAIADATEAYDNLDDMNLYIELRGRAERWSNNLIERIKKRLKKVYKQYDENTKRNNTVIKDTLTDIDEQFSGDIDMAIQYVEMLARMYDWTDDLKIRVIQAVEDRYA
jgi:archaellum component FlaC